MNAKLDPSSPGFDPQLAQRIDNLKRDRSRFVNLQSLVFSTTNVIEDYRFPPMESNFSTTAYREEMQVAYRGAIEAFWAIHRVVDDLNRLIDSLAGETQDEYPTPEQTETQTGGGIS